MISFWEKEIEFEYDFQGRGDYKTYWLSGKDGFDKELPDPVISENNHG